MSDIFISYASEDRTRAKVLAGALADQSWSVWWDREILPGETFWQVIKEAIDQAKCIIVLWSQESVKSEWVQNEASEGNRRKILVPALIDDVEMPFQFKHIQAARLVDWKGDPSHLEFDRLLKAVSAIVGQPSSPKQPEPIPDRQQPDSQVPPPDAPDHLKPTGLETQKAASKSKIAKMLAAICIVTLIAIISIGIFLKSRLPKTYSLTVAAVDGSVTKSPDQATYNHGDTVTLQAVGDSGSTFTGWSGDLTASSNIATLVMDSGKSVTASFALKAGNVVTNSIGMKLVHIPAGSFMMGSSGSAAELAKEYGTKEEDFRDGLPQHQVRISEGFWMGQTEITQGQYKSVMDAQPWSGQEYVQEDPNNPAVYVSWDNAVEFCRKLSQKEGKTYRLPTETEWEYACRAGTTTRFSFGDSDSSLGDYAWFGGNTLGQQYAHPAGQKKPNPWYLYDMHGNVFEWCQDWYADDYYSESPESNPQGPDPGSYRVIRGGSWFNSAEYCRSAFRFGFTPSYRYFILGFRVARSFVSK